MKKHTFNEIINCLKELKEICPEHRVGQLIDQAAFYSKSLDESFESGMLYYMTDEQLLRCLKHLLD